VDAPSTPRKDSAWSALVLLAWVPLWPLLTQRAVVLQHDLFLSDLLHSHLPYRAFVGRELAAGRFPLWMPDVYSGVPFLAQVEAGPLWLPTWILHGLFEPFVAFNLAVVFTVALAGLGTWLLCRRLGALPVAAALGGIAFALSGFCVCHVKHPNLHAAAAMAPWVLWAVERALAKPGSRGGGWPLVGLAVGVQLLAGGPQIAYITLLLAAGRIAWQMGGAVVAAALDKSTAGLRAPGAATAWFAVAVTLGFLLAGAALLPGWEHTSHSPRGGGMSWEDAIRFPYAPADLVTFVLPQARGNVWNLTYPGGQTFQWENYGYVGRLTLMLALTGAVAVVARRRRAAYWVAALAVAFLLMLGPATPAFRAAWEVVPGMQLFRFPARFVVAVDLALAVLAALGTSALAERLASRPRLARTLPLIAVALVAADLSIQQRQQLPMDDASHWRMPSPVAAVISMDGEPSRTFHLDDYHVWDEVCLASGGFRGGYGPFRALAPVPLASSGVLLGLRSPGGYVAMPHRRVARFWTPFQHYFLEVVHQPPQWDAEASTPDRRFQGALDRASVSHVLTREPIADGAGYELLAAFPDVPVYVYRNATALPRAYVATRWESVEDTSDAARWIFRGGLAQPGVPAIEGAQRAPADATGEWLPVPVVERGTDRMELDVSAANAGWLIVSDTWDEGWTATVDGVHQPILPANGYQRAVQLPDGARRVELRYWPPGLSAGLGCTLLSILALFVWCAATRRRVTSGRTSG